MRTRERKTRKNKLKKIGMKIISWDGAGWVLK